MAQVQARKAYLLICTEVVSHIVTLSASYVGKLSTYIIYTEYAHSVVRIDAWGEFVLDLITVHICANLSLKLGKLNLVSERDYVLVIVVYLNAPAGICF